MPEGIVSAARAWPSWAAAALGAAGLLAATPAPASGARPAAPKIRTIDCWPRHCSGLRVAPRGWLRIDADRLGTRSYVQFATGPRRTRWVLGRRRSARRLLVQVPSNAVTGRLRLWFKGRPVSRASRRVTVVRRAPARRPVATSTSVFAGQGMWIWVLPRSEGGSVPAIIARARAAGVSVLYVKGADGTNVWSQFTPQLVTSLKAAGLRVCTWQYTYGSSPAAEAAAAATAISRGADCFVIDAEAEYEDHYAQAQQYVQALRARVGPSYPVALSSFPYVDFHPGFPYSVFLGPGGAQANLPQIYWKAIGTSVDQAYAHTWPLNRVYSAPIYPVGQTYQDPSAGDITRFRGLAGSYGAGGLSWWDWQETTAGGWAALAAPAPAPPRPAAADAWPALAQGAGGDMVVWAQQHLSGAGYAVSADGAFGPATRQAVVRFQAGAGLPQTGRIDAATWPPLLRAPVAARSARAAAAVTPRRAVRNEIPILGRGG